MTIGFVLIMVGIQLNLVESFELTPRFSNFLSDHGGANFQQSAAVNNNPYQQVSYPSTTAVAMNPGMVPVKTVRPPSWLCWPFIFCGTVLVLQGLIKRD